MPAPLDRRGRHLRDLRISVTDRCNLRCMYCMPRDKFGPDHAFLPTAQLLNFEELSRIAAAFVSLGVRKIRLTGGEPLMRRGLPELVARLRSIDPDLDLAMTTNGVLLPRVAQQLADAGLDRVTVSLDSLDDATFKQMSDAGFSVRDVLAGIDAAVAAGLAPVKVNAVVKRGVNDGPELSSVLDLADHFRFTGHTLRFIEFMDVGSTNGWQRTHVIPGEEIVAALDRAFGVEPVTPGYMGEVAGRYRYRDGGGEVGVISSVTRPFCGDCTRARLAPDGRIFACLFAAFGTDLRALLRAGADSEHLEDLLRTWWATRSDRYSELRSDSEDTTTRAEMSYIGG